MFKTTYRVVQFTIKTTKPAGPDPWLPATDHCSLNRLNYNTVRRQV